MATYWALGVVAGVIIRSVALTQLSPRSLIPLGKRSLKRRPPLRRFNWACSAWQALTCPKTMPCSVKVSKSLASVSRRW